MGQQRRCPLENVLRPRVSPTACGCAAALLAGWGAQPPRPSRNRCGSMKTLQGHNMRFCPTSAADLRPWLLPLFLALGCTRTPERGEPPPPPRAQSPCDLPEPPVGRSLPSDLPRRAAGHCVDPRIDVRSYGLGAKAPLDSVCTELFNGECELYKTYGLQAVRTFEYVPTVGTDHAVSVVVSEFRSGQGAFGFYTRRILAGGPPEGLTVQPIEVSGQGALGPGIAYLRRGRHVVELTYVSLTDTPAEVERKSRQLLPPLARDISLSLGGDEELPTVARRAALPGVLELGIELPPDGLFGLTGTGPYAVAYFGEPQPHRAISIESADEASAKDTLRLLLTSGASRKIKGSDVVTLRLAQEEQSPETWYLLRRERLILAIGPALTKSPRVLQGSERERAEEAWSAFAVRRLREAMAHALGFGP